MLKTFNNMLNEYIEKIKKIPFQELICYLLSFFIFSGTNFLKISVVSVGRIFMLFIVLLVAVDIIKNKKIEDFIYLKNGLMKYSIIFLIIWCLYSIISFLWIKDKYMYIVTNFVIITGTFITIYFIKYINRKEIFENILKIAIFTVTCNCILYFFLMDTYEAGFYHNINDLGTVLLFIIPSIIYFIFKDFRENKKLIYRIIQYIICFLTSCLINSRACKLGCIIGIIGFACILIYEYRDKIFDNQKIKLATFIMIIIGISIGSYLCMNILSKITFKPTAVAKGSNQVRSNLIFNAIEFLKQDGNFFKGVGAGNSVYYYKNFSIYPLHETYSAHNLIIQILLEYGICILLGVILLYVCILKNLWNHIKEKNIKDISSVFIFFMCAITIASIASSTLLTQEWFWLILAIIIAWCNQPERI